jgi:hypothetical protein
MTTTELIPALETERAELQRRIEAIDILLGREGSYTVRRTQESAVPKPRIQRGEGVSDIKKRAVLQYIRAHGHARQVQIQKDLNENSGAISLAVRALEAEGKIEHTGEIEAKSKVWRYVRPERNHHNGDRVTEIRPGEGVSQGRQR